MAEEQSYADAVRAEIDTQLGWTPQQVHAEAWDHAVTTAMGVVGPILEELKEEAYRLRREVEFEANADPLTDGFAGRRDNLTHPLCSCASDDQLAALRAANELNLEGPQWSPPQCGVHPDGER
jgi:hypothetical protein